MAARKRTSERRIDKMKNTNNKGFEGTRYSIHSTRPVLKFEQFILNMI